MLYPPMGDVADVIAMVAWWNSHWGQFSFNSDVVCRTSSHIWGRWYLPMFLFRDGSLTLMNKASFIALVRFWSSLPTIVKLLMLILWPEMLQWSNIGEGAFWCSLNLSANILADSPMYSSVHPCWLHLNLYMTALLFVIGSLSLGAMRRFFIVWPPLKNTWTPNMLHDLLILSLSPWWYGTTMYKFLFSFWPVCLVLLVLLMLSFWLLLMAPKDKDPITNKSAVIYRFKCSQHGCTEEYIGESARIFAERFKEHQKAPSPIFDHCNISGHNININNFTIVGREDQNLTRAIKEALFIRVNDPSLNRNIGKYHLPHIWDEVLHTTSELKLNWPQWLFHQATMAITSATSPMGGYNINHQGNNTSLLHYGNNISHWQQHQPIKNKGNNISLTTKMAITSAN